MAWFKVDDRLWGHPKWLATPVRARGLWVTAGSWSAANETDGAIPAHALVTLGGRPGDAADLVRSGLWRTTRVGWVFHDWSVFQPDAASQRAKRAAESTAGSFGNHRRWHERKGVRVPDCEHCWAPADGSGTRSGVRGGTRFGGESPVSDSPPNPPVPVPYPTRKTDGEPSSSIVTLVTRGSAAEA